MGRKTTAAAAAAISEAVPAPRRRVATTLQHELLDDGRSKRGLSQAVGIPEVRLGAIVRGDKPATPEEKAAIARALGKPVGYLFPALSVRRRDY
jgi:hypothetical protein